MDFLKNTRRFTFLYDGKEFWDCEMQVQTIAGGDCLTTEYTLPDGLRVTNFVRKYEKYGAYEWVNWFENSSSRPSGILAKLCDCDCELPFEADAPRPWTAYLPDTAKALKVYAPSGSTWKLDEFYCDVDKNEGGRFPNHLFPGEFREYAASGGRSSEERAPFFNISRQEKGVIVAIGWTGQWACRIDRSENAVRIRSGIEETAFRLLPGEKIRTSSIVLMPYDCGYTASQNRWRRLVKEHFSLIGKPGREQYVPFCATVWGGTTTETVLKGVHRIQENGMPFEYVWMDAGWYGGSKAPSHDAFEGDWASYTGDWRVNENIHPDGLRDVAAAIEGAGKKFLLWIEPERVRYNLPIVSEHPEYFIGPPDAQDQNRLLDLGNEAAWQYCYETVADLIETLGMSCYRQDFNMSPLKFWRMNDAADRKGITEIKHIMGLYRLWDALLERFPHLIIDNCASGGRRIDLETLRRSVPLWRSDAQCPANYAPEWAQVHNMTFSVWMPYSGTGTEREWGDVYGLRSAYAAGLTIKYIYSEKEEFGKDPRQVAWVKHYGEEYLKVRPYFSCDFFPLTEPISEKGGWIAWQFDRPEEYDGIVQVFRQVGSPCETACFALGNIQPGKTCTFTDADGGEGVVLTAEELAKNGFRIAIANQRTAKLYFYNWE